MPVSPDLVASLVQQIAPGAVVERAWPLVGGVSASVTGVALVHPDGSRESLVFRRLPDLDRLAREHALLVRLREVGLPVPRPRWFDEASGTLVLDLVEGTTELPADPAAPLADLLARIHATALDGLPALPERVDPVPELLGWLPGQQGLERIVRDRGPLRGPPCLLHGDYWPGNVLWRGDAVAAVLDWEDAAVGDPLSDLACARVELACAAGDAVCEAFSARYLRRTGLTVERLAVWDLYVSTAALSSMDGWGLPPEVLEARRAVTAAFQARAKRALGL